MKNLIGLTLLLIFGSAAQAQFVNNKGAYIYSEPGALIRVEGSVSNDSAGTIEHKGLIIIDSSFINASSALSKGSGTYDVYLDWINSGHFIRDTSQVNLKGSIQDIKGDSVTRFYNLSLLGLGPKRQFINAAVFNRLNLSVNELATQQDTMFLENTAPGSLMGSFTFGSEAFISNLDTGAFVRHTNSGQVYYYPMGNGSRFRPVQIKPVNTLINKYSLSFFNYNPTIAGYPVTNKDTVLCTVNDKFYHRIGRIVGASPADVEIGYLQASDGYFNTIGNWSALWKDLGSVTNSGSIGGYNSNKRSGWTSFTNLPYALANVRPIISGIFGDTLVCGGVENTYSFVSAANYTYDWGLQGGTFNNNDSTTQSVSVTWAGVGPNHLATLVVTDPASGCSSLTSSIAVTVGISPTAGFNLTPGPYTAGNPIFITDNSQNATSWHYDLGNGASGTNNNSQTVFNQPGTYQVVQTVSDAFGCKDSTSRTIVIEDNLVVGNVFTPNGDGTNDVFTFNCNGCSDYDLEINDRWGLKIYQGTKGSEFWDGTTASGEKVPEGTYFYILKVQYTTSEKLLKGFIQLFR